MSHRHIPSLAALFVLIVSLAMGADMAERYRELIAEKTRVDAQEEQELFEAIRLVEAERDLAIYGKLLELNRQQSLEGYVLSFTGVITQRMNGILSGGQLAICVKGSTATLNVVADCRLGLPGSLKTGDRVTITGSFKKGVSAEAFLNNVTVVPQPERIRQ